MFARGTARHFAAEQMATFAEAYKRKGQRIALVTIGDSFHGGHQAAIRAARRIPGSLVVAALSPANTTPDIAAALAQEGIDAYFTAPQPPATVRLHSDNHDLTNLMAATITAGATDLMVGEDNYPRLVAAQHLVTALGLRVKVHSLPTVRTADGVPLNPRYNALDKKGRDAAVALSAALVAGAHAAAHGATHVLDTTAAVIAAAGLEDAVHTLQLRGLMLGPAPAEGDARLLLQASINTVDFTDSVGLILAGGAGEHG